MLAIANYVLAALYFGGHMVIAAFVGSRWLPRMPHHFTKLLVYALHGLIWLVAAIAPIAWYGPDRFVDAYRRHTTWTGSLMCVWAWPATFLALYTILSMAGGRRGADRLPEQVDYVSRIRPIDRSLLTSPSSRAMARWDLSRVEIVEFTLATEDLPPGLAGLRIAHLTDFHYGGEVSEALLDVASDAVREACPDLVLMTGDFVLEAKHSERCAELAAEICGDAPGYGVIGNHDFWAGIDGLQAAMETRGLRLLRNEGVRFGWNGASLWIAGVDDYWSPTADLDAALREREQGECCILLAHNPDQVMAAAERSVNLQLSGHTHGGHITLPLFGPVIVPSEHGRRFTAGMLRIDKTLVYINRGLAMHPQVRVGSVPEVTLITLDGARRRAG